MRYQNPELRDKLAAEYVLGTLHGLARARFRRLLRYDPALRRTVEDWEARFLPMALATPDVVPPERVWEKIRARIEGPWREPARQGLWQSLSLWRGVAALASVAALALAILLVQGPKTEPPMMIVVMNDKEAQPRIAVSWLPEERGKRMLRVRVMGHQKMEPGTAWELWCLPGGDKPPLSMGLITADGEQVLEVPRNLWPVLDRADGLAMSVEPKGGSPTGLPTGPVLYHGARVTL
ncbi:MAG: anti-sigma factor [Burkholderiales bacterium]